MTKINSESSPFLELYRPDRVYPSLLEMAGSRNKIHHVRLGFSLGLIVFLALMGTPSWAKSKLAEGPCPGSIESVTDPSPVDLPPLLLAVGALRTSDLKPAMAGGEKLLREVAETFDLARVKTKMEQFFRLLHVISSNLDPKLPRNLGFDPADVRNILILSKVFTDPKIPNEITEISLDRKSARDPSYIVRFEGPATEVPLNGNEGFYAWEEGRCQFTKSLIFQPRFSFALYENRKKNLVAKNFFGVDMFGDFGSRRFIEIELQYISLRRVEFRSGTKLGEVEGYISEEEFKKNHHSPFLRLISRFAGTTSTQPIDW
ncbi:MAG: hypothetical protein V1798_06585 [Pseudomonadota bacterium]